MPVPSPREFLEKHIRPNFSDWEKTPLDERHAKNTVGDLNNMSARVFHYWQQTDRSQLRGADNEGAYRNVLVGQLGTDAQVIRDVAEAYKHVTLARPNRVVTNYDQTARRESLWDKAKWDESHWDTALTTILDDGKEIVLIEVAKRAVAFWDNQLRAWKL